VVFRGKKEESAEFSASEAKLRSRNAALSSAFALGRPTHFQLSAEDINSILRSTIPGLSQPYQALCQNDWSAQSKVRWQGTSQDECGQWSGYNLFSEEAAGRVTTKQPATFNAFLMQRHWEPGSFASELNVELFSRQVRLEGVRIAKEAFHLAASGLVQESQLTILKENLGLQLQLWLDSSKADNLPPNENVLALLKKALELIPSILSPLTLSPDGAVDKQKKADILSCMTSELSLTTFFILTDGSWGSLGPYRRDPEVGNFNLGRDMALRMAPNLGLSYEWADLNPVKLPKNVLIERLEWWRSYVNSVQSNPADLLEGIKDLLHVSNLKQVRGISSLGGDERSRLEMASIACEKISGFISDLQADEKGARVRLQDYLVYLSRHRKQVRLGAESSDGTLSMPPLDADLLAHIALGQISRLVGIGSLRSPSLELAYQVDQSQGGSTQFNPFTNMLEVTRVLRISGGPSPSLEAESRKFVGWLHEWIKGHNSDFNTGPMTYNASANAYEITLTAKLWAEHTLFNGRTLLKLQVPSRVYSESNQAPLVVWSLRGTSEPINPSPKTKTWKTTEEERVPFSETTISSGHWEYGGGVGGFYRPQGAFGGSLWQPWNWYFPDFEHRQNVTKNIFKNLFGHYAGSSAIESWPIGASYLLESILPAGSMRKEIARDNVWKNSNLSISDIDRAADASNDHMLRFCTDESLRRKFDPAKITFLGNFDMHSMSQWSLGFHEAFRWYNHAQHFAYAASKTSDKNKQEEMEMLYGVCQTRALSSIIGEFFTGFSIYKPWSVALDLVGNNMVDALHEQAPVQIRYVDNNLKSHSLSEIFFKPALDFKTDFSLGDQTTDGRDVRAGISSPLAVAVGGSSMLANFYGATALAFNHSYDYFLSDHASVGFDFTAGALFGLGKHGMSAEIGSYTFSNSEEGLIYPFSIQEKDFGAFPIFRFQARASADHVSKDGKTWMGTECTLQMGPKNAYDLSGAIFDGGRAVANIFGNNPDSFDVMMTKKGLAYSELYGGPRPLNLNPLRSGAEVIDEFSARGMVLDAKDEASLRAMKTGRLKVTDAKSGYSYNVIAKDGSYSIMPEYDITNPAFGSNWPLAKIDLWAGANLLSGSLGSLRAEMGARLNLNASEAENLYIRAEAQFGGSGKSGPFSVWSQYAIINPLSGSVPQLSAGIRYAPLSTVADTWARNFNASLQYGLDMHEGAKVDFLKITFGYNFRAPPKETTTEYEQVTPINTEWNVNCDGAVSQTILRGPSSVRPLKNQ